MRKHYRKATAVLVLVLAMLGIGGLAVCHSAFPAAPTQQKTDGKQAAKDPVVDDKTILDLIKQLGDDSFEKREAADKKLAAIGQPALELLRSAAKDNPDAEVRQRANELVRLIAARQLSQLRQFVGHAGKRQPWVTSVVFTPDASQAISVGFDDDLRCWDIATGKQILAFGAPKAAYWCLDISKDGKRVIVSGEAKTILVYDVKSGKLVQKLVGHDGQVCGVALLGDGKQAVSGGWDQTIRVWDVEAGKEIRKFEGVNENVRCLAVSPDGKLLAVGHADKSVKKTQAGPSMVRIWDLEKGKEISGMAGHTSEITNVAFSPDGKLLVSSSNDKTVRLWDVAGGKELKRLNGHTNNVTWASFTPDGKGILSCGNQANPWICLWDVASGSQLVVSASVGPGFYCVTALPDNRRFLTAGKDGIVRLWQLAR